MELQIPDEMKAVAIDRFGGPDVLREQTLPVPTPQAKEVLVRLSTAGIGAWDPEVREGRFPLGKPRFPRIIGNDGAGTVVAVGDQVRRFHLGDRVYMYSLKGGFYAEYAAVEEDEAAIVPPGLDVDEAGALGADGVTALIGLEDQLQLRADEKLMVFGASGGIGHIAVQLALRKRARVFAVASGADGVELVRRLGAHAAVDGRQEDAAQAARAFAPDGLDCALVLANGEGLRAALEIVKRAGRVAYPNGVEPDPQAPSSVRVLAYDGEPSRDAFERLNRLIGSEPFHIELAKTYRFEDAALAHREIQKHHLGKFAFRIA